MGWSTYLQEEKAQPYFKNLMARLAQARQETIVYPPNSEVFTAFKVTDFQSVKVVILGQDPYHQHGQAHGLAFSVPPGQAIPPSLQNIYRAIAYDDPSFCVPQSGCLLPWARQGVFLLNTVLTVPASTPQGHRSWGWETFTDKVIQVLSQAHPEPLVFMLWGKPAQSKQIHIQGDRHLVLTAPHPSPLSAHRGFLTCGHFAKANHFLAQHNRSTVNWQI